MIREQRLIWQRLKEEKRPIVMYGMGNGAQKIFDICTEYGIKIRDIFASDGFVRGHSFLGYKVISYSQLCERYDDCVVLLAFAIHSCEMRRKLKGISERYEVLAPDVPVCGTDILTPERLKAEKSLLQSAFARLSDDTSRAVFKNVIEFKLSGRPQYLFEIETERQEVFQKLFRLSEREVYVDLGAYNGDTVCEFLEATRNRFERIIAVEPDPKNFKKLCRLEGVAEDPRIEAHNLAAWSRETTLGFSCDGGRNSHIRFTGTPIKATSVDSLLDGQPASLIKIDVEGAEREAIEGARATISKFAPKLAVSAYHHTTDFYSLVDYIGSLNPEYRVFLRHHPYIPAWETNIYATL